MCNCTLWGLANLVRCATEAGVSVDSRFPDTSQEPVLIHAAQEGYARVVRVLLDAGAECNAVDLQGTTALLRAAQGGHLDCVQLLLAAGADARNASVIGNTPLLLAVVSSTWSVQGCSFHSQTWATTRARA
jgi:ankyrin repeat protein